MTGAPSQSTPLFRAIFPSADAAQGFVTNLLADPTSLSNAAAGSQAELGASVIYPGITSSRTSPAWRNLTLSAARNGGSLLSSSTYRESFVYNYQSTIVADDYHYLLQRDPTASLILRWPAEDTWSEPPRTPSSPPIDQAMEDLILLGFPRAATSADLYAALDGFAFIYIVTSSPPEQPLARGDTVFGFEVITASHLPRHTDTNPYRDDAVVYDTDGDDRSVPYHRIKSLTYFPDPAHNQAPEDEVIVHGSKLIPIFDDPRATTPLQASPALLPVFDDLQNLRDIVYAQTRGIMEGNPIVVEVDTEAGYELDDDEVTDITDELETFVRGSSQSFSPLEGLTMKRLGPSELGDTNTAVRTLASRISHATRIPVNMILASSRGSEQVTDEDFITYASIINQRRIRIALPVYNYLSTGVFTKASPATSPRGSPTVPIRARFPVREMEWPDLRVLNEKDRMLVYKNQAQTLMFALMSGYTPSPDSDILRKFQPNTTPIDPKFILPRQPNWIIQDVDEEWDGPSGGDAGVLDGDDKKAPPPAEDGA